MTRILLGGMLAAFCMGFGIAASIYHAPVTGPIVWVFWGLIATAAAMILSGFLAEM